MKQTLIELIKEFHALPFPSIVKRELTIPYHLKKAHIIYGLRRAGKTYYLFQIMQQFLEEQKIQKQELFYVNFEDERLDGFSSRDFSKLMEVYYELNPSTKEPFLFLDEIQEVEGWEKFVRRITERGQARVFITGSSSKLLSREIATELRGRTLSYELFPFSFREFLKAKNIKDALIEQERGIMHQALQEYFTYGGYPELVSITIQDKIRTLKEYFDLIIYRDVIERFQIKQLPLIKLVARSLIESFSKEFSLLKYYRFLKSQQRKVSKNTLYLYSAMLEEVSFFFATRRYSKSLRALEGSPPKIYLTDIGYAELFGKTDIGRRMENVVALELKRRKEYTSPTMNIYYYKSNDGKEVDFMVEEKGNVINLIQVCYDINDYQVKEREVRSLLKASRDLHCDNVSVITYDKEDDEKVDGRTIHYIPILKWLLQMDEAND